MALIRNGSHQYSGLERIFGAAGAYGLRGNFDTSGRWRAFDSGQHAVANVTNRSSAPQGARHPVAWKLPTKAGGLASHNEAQGEATAALSLADGRNIATTAAGSSTASATLQLVVSLAGTSAGSAGVSGNVVASLSAAGTSAGSCTAAATAGAIAWAYGTTPGSTSVSATITATGRLYGSITPFTELSPENLASAVIAAAAASPIAADIRKVNAYTIDGDGSGTPWGPA